MPDWPAEYAALAAADRDGALPAPQLERLAVIAGLLGRDADVVELRQRAIELYLAAGDVRGAVVCGSWLGFYLRTSGAQARASGWFQRLAAVAADSDDPWVHALLDQLRAAELMYAGEAQAAVELFEIVAVQARRVDSLDHYVLSRMAQGRCLQALGRAVEARATLDEAMVYVAAGRVAPHVIGLAYCSMIDLCRGWYDIRRAREWTEALTGWLDEQHGMLPYRGTCLVHRAELTQLRGAWALAEEEADEACVRLRVDGERAAAPAYYRLGELARLRGDLEAAERAFEQAAAVGHEVQPGLARLRLAQGRPDAAVAGLDRALAERRDPRAVPELLCARVDACLTAGELAAARETLDRLLPLVPDDAAPFLRAMASFAEGTLRCAEGDWGAALPLLRSSFSTWSELDARYEAAAAQLALARACAALGDGDAAQMERAAGLRSLEALGALVPDGWMSEAPVPTVRVVSPPREPVVSADGVDGGPGGVESCPLSPRELEVLRILATGATNRVIASELVLSEKTVARHVSNIFVKLGVASRSAATARAYEQHWA